MIGICQFQCLQLEESSLRASSPLGSRARLFRYVLPLAARFAIRSRSTAYARESRARPQRRACSQARRIVQPDRSMNLLRCPKFLRKASEIFGNEHWVQRMENMSSLEHSLFVSLQVQPSVASEERETLEGNQVPAH